VVKRLKKYPQKVCLVSEQEGYEPITVSDVDDIYIWGVVVGSARVFA
jgi:SOS-response transcriptional repressor LexA